MTVMNNFGSTHIFSHFFLFLNTIEHYEIQLGIAMHTAILNIVVAQYLNIILEKKTFSSSKSARMQIVNKLIPTD